MFDGTSTKREGLKSLLLRYGLSVLIFGVTLGIQNLLAAYSIRLSFTIPIIVGLVVAAWYGGRGPAILLAILYVTVTAISTPIAPNSTTGQWAFGHFSNFALMAFIVLVISGRKAVEKRLRESGDRYRNLVENAHDIIYSHDLEGNYTSINAAGEQITGYSYEEALKMNFLDTVVPESAEKAREMIAQTVAGTAVSAYKLDIITKDGNRKTVEVNTTLVFDDEVPVGVQGIARDITERKQLEEEILQSQKLESLGRLAGGIAHDFNNMLTAINGYSDLVLRRLGPDDPSRQNVEEIRKAGERSGLLTNQLLAFSRKQILRPETVQINHVIRETSNMLQRLIGEDIELVTVLQPKVGSVNFDPGQLSQVIMNLAVNARDAMPTGGKLTIETSNIFLDPDYTNHHVGVLPGAYILLSVSDTGIGISSEMQDQIFEPFFTTKISGTGLGLATVYGIVKQSGGNILVYSEIDHGTTFKVYLPRVAGPLGVPSTEAAPTGLATGKETILLVEDEETVRALSKQVLELCGYTVIEAHNGVDALSICEKYNGRIDLLMTDVVMPEMGGRELAERIRQLYPKIYTLFTSGYTDDAIIRHGVIGDGVNFIQKPFSLDALATKVRTILDDHDIA
jgi:two-component system, cell cycle sensor histidine kinase and response regulator CckA